MRRICLSIMAGLIFAVFIPAAEKTVDLNGTWTLDPARSDLGGQTRRTSRAGGIPGLGGGFPGGIGFPGGGIGFPGGVGLPGGGYPNPGGYPGGRSAGGYPNGGGGDDGGELPGDGTPGGQIRNLALEIVQKDDEVQTTRTFAVNGEGQTIAQRFTLDGSENTNPASNGRGEFVSTSTWKNGKLINSGSQNVRCARLQNRCDGRILGFQGRQDSNDQDDKNYFKGTNEFEAGV